MKNGYNIDWTSEAEQNLNSIFNYLEAKWTQREISNFATKLEITLQQISTHPTAFPYYNKEKNIRRCVFSSQTTIYYTELPFENKIVIITLFDNRQNIDNLSI